MKKFCDLPPPYSEEKNAKIVILPVPFDLTTTYVKGADKGPSALIEASKNLELYDIETDSEVFKKGIFTAPPIIKNSSQEMLKELYGATKHYLEKDKFIVTIGGEHSISFAPIRAHGKKYKNISVLHFDAHADLILSYENNPWSHASVMARTREIKEVNNIISLGIRSMSKEEEPLVQYENTFFAHNIFDNDSWMDKAISLLKPYVYITFDLDVFDISIMPATGTPEPGGLKWYQILKFLKKVAKLKQIIGFDVVELCPIENNIAPDFMAAKLVYKLLSYIFIGE